MKAHEADWWWRRYGIRPGDWVPPMAVKLLRTRLAQEIRARRRAERDNADLRDLLFHAREEAET